MHEIASNIMKDLPPSKLVCYEGIMNGSRIYYTPVNMENFCCPDCKNTSCYQLLHENKKYLSCASEGCIAENSNKPKFEFSIKKPSLIDLGVPEEHVNSCFNKCYADEETKKALIEYARKPFGFCTISGSAGRGKTYAAVCVIAEYLKQGIDAQFISHSDLNQEWLAIASTGSATIHLLNRLQTKKLLILDDLGCMKFSESFGDFIFMLIDKRKNSQGLGTLITTNLDAAQMAKTLGGPLVSRLMPGLKIKMEGNDKRIPFPNQKFGT